LHYINGISKSLLLHLRLLFGIFKITDTSTIWTLSAASLRARSNVAHSTLGEDILAAPSRAQPQTSSCSARCGNGSSGTVQIPRRGIQPHPLQHTSAQDLGSRRLAAAARVHPGAPAVGNADLHDPSESFHTDHGTDLRDSRRSDSRRPRRTDTPPGSDSRLETRWSQNLLDSETTVKKRSKGRVQSPLRPHPTLWSYWKLLAFLTKRIV
jgi:hypothetical protein